MVMEKRKILGVLGTAALALTIFTSPASAATYEQLSDYQKADINLLEEGMEIMASTSSSKSKRFTVKRGGALAWSKNVVEWNYTGSKVSSSSAWQSRGYVFPNKVSLNGIKRTETMSSYHKYRGTTTLSHGIPTPWGDIDFYSRTYVDIMKVNKDGTGSRS
ncbi:hypothetical protein [Peribacillus frigoritolerans]|uniref:Uncharacterized protein n=1 Tax=Peribacillus castrilensis TaxID=2897690 RepID=A0AAW9NF52_9BACI|nr:hypothetical protein [Peribacillus castrilensis]